MLRAESLEVLELVLLGREAAVAADPVVEDRARCLRQIDEIREPAPAHHRLHDPPRQRQCRAGLPGDRARQRPEVTHEAAVRGLARRARLRRDAEEQRLLAIVGILRQRTRHQPDAAVAVHERVVHLRVDREPPALQALDQMHFPWGPAQIERIAVQPGDQHTQLTLVARAGQSRTPHVVVEVEIPVDHPGLKRAAHQPGIAQLAVPRRVHLRVAPRLRDQLAQERRRRVRGRLERHQRGDVHHRVRPLAVQEHDVQRRQPLRCVRAHSAPPGSMPTSCSFDSEGRRARRQRPLEHPLESVDPVAPPARPPPSPRDRRFDLPVTRWRGPHAPAIRARGAPARTHGPRGAPSRRRNAGRPASCRSEGRPRGRTER